MAASAARAAMGAVWPSHIAVRVGGSAALMVTALMAVALAAPSTKASIVRCVVLMTISIYEFVAFTCASTPDRQCYCPSKIKLAASHGCDSGSERGNERGI